VARVNIEDSIYTDQRFLDLFIKLGNRYEAVGMLVTAWTLAQKWYVTPSRMIPLTVWREQRMPDALIETGLAEIVDGEFVRMRGADDQFAWLKQRQAAGKNGGIASGIVRREIIDESAKRTEAKRSGANPLTLTPPLSLDLTKTKQKKEPSGGQLDRQADLPSMPTPTQEFIGAYVKAFQSRYPGGRPDLSPKVQGGIKRLLAGMPLDRACAMIQVYLQLDEPWFKTKAYDFGTFEQNLSKVGLALDTGRDPSETRHKGIGELLAEEEAENERRLT
jgi:hypothetical protein